MDGNFNNEQQGLNQPKPVSDNHRHAALVLLASCIVIMALILLFFLNGDDVKAPQDSGTPPQTTETPTPNVEDTSDIEAELDALDTLDLDAEFEDTDTQIDEL